MTARILLVEDDPIQRMELRQMLTAQGYAIVGEAAGGQSVLNLADTLRPDLVLMDIRLPEQDGISIAALLNQKQIAPVVLLSAFCDASMIERARDAGVASYLLKPLREDQIKPAIEITLARQRAKQMQEDQMSLVQAELDVFKRAQMAPGNIEEAKRRWERAIKAKGLI